jgi:hypothetical protein
MSANRLWSLFACCVAACSHEVTSPSEQLSSVSPDLVCSGPSVSAPDGVTTVALSGSAFTPMPSRTLADPRQLLLPRVTLVPAAALPGGVLPGAPVEVADDPANPAASRVHWTSESAMSFDVVPVDALPTGVFDVTVTNPDARHASTLSQVLAILPPPVVTAAQPMGICDVEADQTVVVTGASFLVFDGATPTVTIAAPGGARSYPSTFSAADCQPVPGSFAEHAVALCRAIEFSIPQGDITVTANTKLSLVVTNPPPADCASSTAFEVTLDVPPRVDSVVPSTVCQGGAQLTINGANFLPGAKVTLRCPGVAVVASEVVVNAAGTEISATLGGGMPADTTCDVIVTNADSCDDRPLPHKTVHVTAGPIAFFVDPPVVFNGITTRITIFSTTITQPLAANAVTIRSGGTETQLAFNSVPGFPNRLQAIVPTGQLPGAYDLMLEDGLHCPTVLPAAFSVTDTTSVTLARVVSPFGAAAGDTAVTVLRDTTAATPNDHPLVDTPRVFLNPHSAAPTDVAVAMESVAFLDADHVTGIVPAGTPANVYDVVLVNPDGTVGVLASGYTETTTALPDITAATPASIVDATGQHVTLSGDNFAAGDTVGLTCRTSGGAVEAAVPVVAAAPVCGAGSCTQAVTIDGSALAIGSICVARVTNPDGAFSDFSAIGVTNSSLNLDAPQRGSDMTIGRRALVAAAGNATAANRFVYAIGGDDGSTAGAFDTVEYAPVDLFGTFGAFAVQPPRLRAPRTLAGAVTVGRYVYLVGGNDGTGPTASAERAMILAPQEAPQIVDVDLQLQAAGLDPGTYHYRVSAVFSASDPDNPGGESLASDEFTIRLPSFPGKKLAITLIWRAPVDALGAALPNVTGYRVYRTAKDGAPGSELLLGNAPATPRTFVDDGSQIPGTAVPLPLGSTGTWAALPDLGTKREGLAVTAARDPSASNTFYVYALLGRSSATTATASYELLPVTVAANGRQTVAAAWTPGTVQSAQARWQLGAWTVDSTVSSLYAAGTSFVFAGGGITAAGASAIKVEAGRVTAGGQLASFDDTPKDISADQAGYGVCAANGQLFSFGGLNGSPSSGAQSASLIGPPPALAASSWNNEGLTMTHGRYLLGSAVQSSFIFLLGGQTNEPSAASKTTELVIW